MTGPQGEPARGRQPHTRLCDGPSFTKRGRKHRLGKGPLLIKEFQFGGVMFKGGLTWATLKRKRVSFRLPFKHPRRDR